jgi:hypothetical protein
MWRQLDKGLDQAAEELLLPKAVGVDIVIHLGEVASLPQTHEAVNPIDVGYGTPGIIFQSEGGFAALVPSFEPHHAATLRAIIIFSSIFFHILVPGTARGEGHEVPGIGEGLVGKTAGKSIKNTGSGRSVAHAKVMAMEEVVGGRLIKMVGFCSGI